MPNEPSLPPPYDGMDFGPPPPPPPPLKSAAQQERDKAVAEIADRTFNVWITYAVIMAIFAVIGLVALAVIRVASS